MGRGRPAAATGSADQKREAFRRAFAGLKSRIDRLLALRPEQIDRAALKRIGDG